MQQNQSSDAPKRAVAALSISIAALSIGAIKCGMPWEGEWRSAPKALCSE